VDLGKFIVFDSTGQKIDSANSRENANTYSLAVSFDYWLKIGFGLSYKHS